MCITTYCMYTHTYILLLIIIVCKTIQENPKIYQILNDSANQIVSKHTLLIIYHGLNKTQIQFLCAGYLIYLFFPISYNFALFQV